MIKMKSERFRLGKNISFNAIDEGVIKKLTGRLLNYEPMPDIDFVLVEGKNTKIYEYKTGVCFTDFNFSSIGISLYYLREKIEGFGYDGIMTVLNNEILNGLPGGCRH